ncbi:DUF4430 domain-containing protein [Streptomyces inhibens]|uniref:DUF4430 domain-containing protein n=1 Tax=Streptomyces inhibens TaxID=2293571 RepID=UPI003690F6C6
MPSALARKAAPVTAAGIAFALALTAAPPAAAIGPTASVRVKVTGGAFTASVGTGTQARFVFGGFYCAAGDGSPTPLTALVDADERFDFGVQARWDAATQDFVVTSIHGDFADDSKKWTAYVNEKKITTGPCGTAIKDNDKVRWTLEAPKK